MKNKLFTVVAASISIIIAILLIELFARIFLAPEIFTLKNFRYQRMISSTMSDISEFDELLGWKLKDYYKSPGFNTSQYGIRKNSPNGNDPSAKDELILAVGDSFTAGSEVIDSETWPAHLNNKIGTQVLNGGVGGYGTDQIILRASRLAEIYHPKYLLLSFLIDSDIERANFSSYGRSKPYYTNNQGNLQFHKVEQKYQESEDISILEAIKNLGGYFYSLDKIFSSFAPNFWFANGKQFFKRINNDPIAITCQLLKESNFGNPERKILILQYGGSHIEKEIHHAYSQDLIDCAQDANFQVIDTYYPLREKASSNIENFKKFYVMRDGQYGHMSSSGNEFIASYIQQFINDRSQNQKSEIKASKTSPPPTLNSSENLLNRDLSHPTISFKKLNLSEHEISPSNNTGGEHYISTIVKGEKSGGAFNLSIKFDQHKSSNMRIQILDSASKNAVFADLNLKKQLVTISRLNKSSNIRYELKKDVGDMESFQIYGIIPGNEKIIRIQFLNKNMLSVNIENNQKIILNEALISLE